MAYYNYVPLRWFGWAAVAIVANQHLYTIKVVSGRSMQPTLNPDTSPWRDVLVFDRTVAASYKCDRGDIVAFRSPTEPHELLVKRIIALGGDEVQTLHPHPDPVIKVPEGYMWVEGDEPFHSNDSNKFGPIPLALLDSKTTFRIWPLARFGPIDVQSKARTAPVFSAAWRLQMDAVNRERRRRERVHIAQSE